MSALDAQAYWISRRIPTDQFLLYCFDGAAASLPRIRSQVLARAATIGDLRLRVREVPVRADRPYWTPMTPDASLIRLQHGPMTWTGCLDAVAALLTEQLDACESPWRLQLFGPVSGAPERDGPAVVAVLQVAHALADGRRAAALARELFGTGPVPAVASAPWRPALALTAAAVRLPVQIGQLVWRARPAHRAHRQRERDTAAGTVPPAAPSRPLLLTNAEPDERRELRTVVVAAADLRRPGVTVTVGALTAISVALSRYLHAHGESADAGVAAEVTVAKPGEPAARNHFHNVAVELHPGIDDLSQRAAAIAESLRLRRLRADHPAGAAEDRALAAVPAPLLRHGIDRFDFTAVPAEVTGNTVVSSVDRGPADLTLGGGRVRFTAGFPALSRFMGLTHGVHGIGDIVTISVATSPAVVPDVDAYERLLRTAVAEVASALAADRFGS